MVASPQIVSLGLYLFIALIASALFAIGLLLMKSRARHLPIARGPQIWRAMAAWVRDPIWDAGLLIQTLGYALFVLSLAEAPISLVSVAMQGGIALFVLFAVAFLGERARPVEWAGIAITILGMLLLAVSLTNDEAQAPTDTSAMVMVSVILFVVGYLPMRMPRFIENGVGAAIFSGFVFGLASLYTKGMTDDYQAREAIAPAIRIVTNIYVYGVIIANIVGMIALQNSFFSARGIIAMPLSSALSNIVPIVGGMIVFGERLPSGTAHSAMRIGAFVLTVVGSALLANAQEEIIEVVEAGVEIDSQMKTNGHRGA
jgi:drug/metabolite transporter (DMT)-like permease